MFWTICIFSDIIIIILPVTPLIAQGLYIGSPSDCVIAILLRSFQLLPFPLIHLILFFSRCFSGVLPNFFLVGLI
jgi:hypothetical protein